MPGAVEMSTAFSPPSIVTKLPQLASSRYNACSAGNVGMISRGVNQRQLPAPKPAHGGATLGVSNRILEIEIPQTPAVKLKKDGSRQSTEEKVFPGYVLVRMVLDEDTMMAVRSTPNVINFVGAEDRRATGKARGHIKPRPLSRTEVDRIFKRAAEKKTVVKVDLTEGDQILVTGGPFKDFQGEVIEVSGERNKLKALLSIFGRETPVELEFSQISKQN